MPAYGRALDLRHLAWGLENKGLIESLANAIDRCNILLTADLTLCIGNFPEWLPDQEPICEGELRTFHKQCAERDLDGERVIELLHILHAAMEGAVV
jgi:hypothetical protein